MTAFSSGGTLSTGHNVNTINNIELGHSFDDNGDNDDDVERIKRPNLSRVKREEDKISPSKLIEQQQYLMKMVIYAIILYTCTCTYINCTCTFFLMW